MNESPYPMLPVAQALEIVLRQAQRLPEVTVDVQDSVGLVLARSIAAEEPLPPFPASVKDGYAVIAADGPGVFPVTGEATAGKLPGFDLSPGTVAYITTGAPLPAGADAVVMVEETENLPARDGLKQVRILQRVEPGADVRPVGIDVVDGQEVLQAGDRLGAAEVGLLATVGMIGVAVYPRPRIAVLSTGDELVEPGGTLKPGQIRDSNRAMLLAAIRSSGGEPVDLGVARDSRSDLQDRVWQGLRSADMLLTSGGVSMGDLDLIKPLLEHAGTVHFGRILMKPGKPLTFATAEVEGSRKLIFGLPGNPVSSLVTFYLMAVPAMRRMAGWANPELKRVSAALGEALPLDPVRPEYHRATLRWLPSLNDGRGGYHATSTGNQASSRLLSMRTANALLELPQGDATLAPGETVTALVIGEI